MAVLAFPPSLHSKTILLGRKGPSDSRLSALDQRQRSLGRDLCITLAPVPISVCQLRMLPLSNPGRAGPQLQLVWLLCPSRWGLALSPCDRASIANLDGGVLWLGCYGCPVDASEAGWDCDLCEGYRISESHAVSWHNVGDSWKFADSLITVVRFSGTLLCALPASSVFAENLPGDRLSFHVRGTERLPRP